MAGTNRGSKSDAVVTPVYFLLDRRLGQDVDIVQAHNGVARSEQSNRAVRFWLDTDGVKLQTSS